MKNGLNNSPKLSLTESLTTPGSLGIIGAAIIIAALIASYEEKLMNLVPPRDIDKGSIIF